MATYSQKILRMRYLLSMMRRGEYPNYNRFAKSLDEKTAALFGKTSLAPKTFTRDIAELKKIFKAPVEYDPSRKGFYLSKIEWTSSELAEAPQSTKTLAAGTRIAELMAPQPLRSELKKALNCILSSSENVPRSINTLRIFKQDKHEIDPHIFKLVYSAWEIKRSLEITYTSAKNETSVKKLNPHILAWQDGDWYLKGEVTNSDDSECCPPEVRVFAIHRISEAKVLSAEFLSLPQFLDQSKPLFDFDSIKEVRIRFFKPFGKLISDRFSCKSGCAVKFRKSDESAVLTLNNIFEYEAVDLVLYSRGESEILKPAELKKTVSNIGRKLVRNNKI